MPGCDTVHCIRRGLVGPVGALTAARRVDMSGGGGAALRLLPMAFPLFVVVVLEHNGRHPRVVLEHNGRWHPKTPTRQRSRGGGWWATVSRVRAYRSKPGRSKSRPRVPRVHLAAGRIWWQRWRPLSWRPPPHRTRSRLHRRPAVELHHKRDSGR